MAIKQLSGGTLVLTGEHIQWASYAAAFSIAKLDLCHRIKLHTTSAAWRSLAKLCQVNPPRSREQKLAIYDRLAPYFPTISGMATSTSVEKG